MNKQFAEMVIDSTFGEIGAPMRMNLENAVDHPESIGAMLLWHMCCSRLYDSGLPAPQRRMFLGTMEGLANSRLNGDWIHQMHHAAYELLEAIQVAYPKNGSNVKVSALDGIIRTVAEEHIRIASAYVEVEGDELLSPAPEDREGAGAFDHVDSKTVADPVALSWKERRNFARFSLAIVSIILFLFFLLVVSSLWRLIAANINAIQEMGS